MLVHHSYPQGVRVIGVSDNNVSAILPDSAFLRLIQSEKNTHQGRFTRSVFTEQSMNLALTHMQGNVVIGDNGRETLCNIQHFNGIRFVQF